MARSEDYLAGFTEASRKAMTLIHATADGMNHSSARDALHAAAHEVGLAFARHRSAIRDDMERVEG